MTKKPGGPPAGTDADSAKQPAKAKAAKKRVPKPKTSVSSKQKDAPQSRSASGAVKANPPRRRVPAAQVAPSDGTPPASVTEVQQDERLLLDVIDALRGSENLRDRLLTTLQTGTPAVADLAYAVKARIKEDYKAIEKIKDRRTGGGDRDPRPDYGAADVTDLIGLRIITLYRLDVLDILDALIATINADTSASATFVANSISEVIIYSTNPGGDVQSLPGKLEALFEGYGLGAVTRVEAKPSNYSSIHILIRGRGKYRDGYRELPIEIQVRTALEDVWGQIEHSLKYKRKRLASIDGNAREARRLATTLNHLGALKTMIDGIAQYGDQIKLQIDDLEPEVRSTASKEAEEVSARLKSLRDLPAGISEEIAAAVAVGKPGLGRADLSLQVRDRILRSALARLDVLADIPQTLDGLSAKTRKELRYIITMQRALLQFQLGNLHKANSNYLAKALELYTDLERTFPARLVIVYRLARTLDALGSRSEAITRFRELIERLATKNLLPARHWIRSAAPRNLGVLLWEEARSRSENGADMACLALLREACTLSKIAYDTDVEEDPHSEIKVDEHTKAANNLLYFLLEYLEIGGEETEDLGRGQLVVYLNEIGGAKPSEITTLSAADTARRAHAFLGNIALERQAAHTVVRLVGPDGARTPSARDALRAAERTLNPPGGDDGNA